MTDRRSWPRREYGTCVYQSVTYVYVPIPKCASTWMKHKFGKHRGNFEREHPDPNARYVVVLRDPIDRWISGLAQVHHGNPMDWYLHYRNIGWDQIMNTVVFDNHTEPQYSYIQNIDFDRTTWFKFGNGLERAVTDWAQDRFDLRPLPTDPSDDQVNAMQDKPALEPGRTLSGAEMLQEIKTTITRNPQYIERLREFYHKDFQLYESVSFYRPR